MIEDAIPDVIGLASATEHPLAPYLPRIVVDWITTTPDARYREMTGTLAFVDISGFTKLSEGLARHGKVGAEELTATIGACFVDLLDLAYRNGGRLLKFGGDALLLFFSGEGHEARACRAAIDMRRALRVVGRLTVLGQRVALRMSVGVHSGLFHFFLIGDSHRELIVTGPAASTTVSMEATAQAGEIVISDATARALRPSIIGARKGPGHLLIRAPAIPEDAFAPFEHVEADLDLWGAIPIGLRETLTSSRQDSEHRRVTVAFIRFDGTDRLIEEVGPEVAADQLDALVAEVQRAVDRQQVAFLATDIDHNGGKIILTAGAPSTSGDDEDRMLLALREVVDAGTALPIRIGVNRGPVFVGEIGPPYRKTFTVMGDAVNLAARLMAKAAPGQVLMTPDVFTRARTGFESLELEPFFVKGKAKPVRAISLGSKTRTRTDGFTESLPFVGRRDELAIIDQMVNAAKHGNGQFIEIVGEPGVGKSRLLEELRHLVPGSTELSAVCERYDATTPYLVVRKLLRDLLHLPPEANSEAVAAQFLAELAQRAPSVLPWAPLIGAAIDLSVPETAESSELEEAFRRPRLAAVVIELLANLVPEAGLITLEDAHYMDEASADFFEHFARNVGTTSWLICSTRRDLETGFVAPMDSTVRLDLLPLRYEEASELARVATRDAPPLPHELDAIVQRAGGNPLFLCELLAAAANSDGVDGLPDSVEDVVVARIDRLSADDRHLLRKLSVLGQSFSLDLLSDVFDDLPAENDATWTRLEGFVARDSSGNMSFRNRLWRDAAYDGLSFRLRRDLHARAGDQMVAAAEKRGTDQPEMLSFHYLHAQRYREAWTYSLIAAERANAVYANIEASEFYERALVAGRRLPEVTDAELSAVYEALGDARNRTGAYLKAATAYRAARRLAAEDRVGQARLMLSLARVQGWLDRYASALRWITKGLRVLEGAEGLAAKQEQAELLCWYGRFCQEEGHHERAIRWCTLAIEQAEAADARLALADALKVVDWAKMDLGKLEEPSNWIRALDLFEELGDLHGQASMLNLLGGLAYFRGAWGDALDHYQRAQAIMTRTGNAVLQAFYMNNMAEVALEQGRFEEAERQVEDVARTWRAAGYRAGSTYVKCNLGRVATGQGRYRDALRLYEEAIQASVDVGSQGQALEARSRMAECLLVSGQVAEALSLADDALSQARRLGGVAPQTPLLQRVRGVALAGFGDATAAHDALEQSLQAARSRGAEYELALTLHAIGECDACTTTAHRDELRSEAAEILRKLGVVGTPGLPLPISATSDSADDETSVAISRVVVL